MFKFNNGNGAVVCDICGKIIRTGEDSYNNFDICNDCQKIPPVVDNFELLADTMVFDDENTFYWVQIIKRRKDNPGMHGDYQSFGDYWIYSTDQLFELKDEIIKSCKTHNARAVLWINRRDSKEITFEVASMALEYMRSKQFNASHSIVQHITGKNRKKYSDESIKIPQLYIVDLDSKEESYVNKVSRIIKECTDNESFNMNIVPTLHGYHIICPGFNITKFEHNRMIAKLDKIDIHKDNPTLLYFCPK